MTVLSRLLAAVALGAILASAALLSGCGGSSSLLETPSSEGSTALAEGSAPFSGSKGSDAKTPDPAAGLALESVVSPAALDVVVTGDSVVDEDAAEKGGNPAGWYRATGVGYGSDMLWTYANGGKVDDWRRWKSGLGAGNYEVLVFIPRRNAGTTGARYRVQQYVSGAWQTLATKTVNQSRIWDNWVSLGTYTFSGQPAVYLADDAPEALSKLVQVGFDAAWFRRPPSSTVERAKLDSLGRAHADLGQAIAPGWCLAIVSKRWSKLEVPSGYGACPRDTIKYFRERKKFVGAKSGPLEAPEGAWVFWTYADNGPGHIALRCKHGLIHQPYPGAINHTDGKFTSPAGIRYAGYVKWEDVYACTPPFTGSHWP